LLLLILLHCGLVIYEWVYCSINFLLIFCYISDQTQVTKCDQFVDSTQCNSDGLPSALSCFWLYDSLTGESGSCKAKDASLACGDAKRPSQCPVEADAINSLESINCFWLYSGIETAGDGGSCVGRNDDQSCSMVKRESQCPLTELNKFTNCIWISTGSGGVGSCETIATTCEAVGTSKEMCNTPGAAVASSGTKLDCFFLYSETSEETGNCRSRTDTTLSCSDVMQERQCPLTDVSNLGSDECLWLVGNATRNPAVVTRCKKKAFRK
jgi:hypothetical protein